MYISHTYSSHFYTFSYKYMWIVLYTKAGIYKSRIIVQKNVKRERERAGEYKQERINREK